ARFKRSRSLVDVQEDLVGEPARNAALAELPLRVYVAIELVWIPRQTRAVTEDGGQVHDAARPRAGNDGLELTDLPVLERVGRLTKGVGEASRERELIEGMDPVRSEVVELPV